MKHLFAYGTLMCPGIMRDVCALSLTGEEARLTGYSRRAIIGHAFPGLIESATECSPGILYRDVPLVAWDRLDRFEGAMYARRAVQVQLRSGDWVEADTYVVEAAYHSMLSAELWDYERFLESGRRQFESNYAGYEAL